jgi:GT2 family glycosyltransferase
MTVTIAIPTYRRGAILLSMLERVFALEPPAEEIVVVDQTADHPREVAAQLKAWSRERRITWIRRDTPSIPQAMNHALRVATSDLVLFLDDDVEPVPDIVAAHASVYSTPGVWAVVGQCLDPGVVPEHYRQPMNDYGIRDLGFRFNHDEAVDVANVIAMNLSVRRERALAIGGFDENYVMVAYRFESDFALRLVAAGGRIRFEPRASVRHLKIPTGGTRAYGDHRTSTSPAHSAGDYYFALHHAQSFASHVSTRLRKNVLTRYHATHPWTIPAKLLGELRGLLLARRLARQGRKLLRNHDVSPENG